MALRATTHEQFRIVLRWVKEHPVLARNDNEVEKGGRELKNKLWEKLAIELNEIGPPVRTWMAWKRVLTDYKYSLKKKIQRRIANTSQGGIEILASLNDLETEALQASLLDWDFSDPDKIQLSDTPPVDELQTQKKSPEEILAGALEVLQTTENSNNIQGVNGTIEPMDTNHPAQNGNNTALSLQTTHNDMEIKLEIPENTEDQNFANGNALNVAGLHSSENIPGTFAENQMQYLPIKAEDLTFNRDFRTKTDETQAQNQDTQHMPNQGQLLAAAPGSLPQSSPMFANVPEAAPILQSIFMSNSTTGAPNDYNDTGNGMTLPQTQPPQPTLQQPPIPQAGPQEQLQQQAVEQSQSQQQESAPQLLQSIKQEQQTPDTAQQPLTSEAMNSLIAREIDRMALAHKTRKATQRKHTKTRAAKESAATPEQKTVKERVQKPPASDQPDRTKRVAAKRPRPRPKEPKEKKRPVSGREFRECLLRLLTDANEMEKRRIAITETKVRNQTEIQNLEITRMNLEIMKLQKEITLLDHGAKILP